MCKLNKSLTMRFPRFTVKEIIPFNQMNNTQKAILNGVEFTKKTRISSQLYYRFYLLAALDRNGIGILYKSGGRKNTYSLPDGTTLNHVELVNALITLQGGKCPCCGLNITKLKEGVKQKRGLKEPVIDHHHDSGFIRCVLHSGCNQTDGYMLEDIAKVNGLNWSKKQDRELLRRIEQTFKIVDCELSIATAA